MLSTGEWLGKYPPVYCIAINVPKVDKLRSEAILREGILREGGATWIRE